MLAIILIFIFIIAVLAIAALTDNIRLARIAVFATYFATAFTLVYGIVKLILLIGGGY